MSTYHTPVMLNECIEGPAIKPAGTYVDVTFGGGGHSREILKHLNKDGRLLAFDQDADAQQNVIADERFVFIDQNFRYLKTLPVCTMPSRLTVYWLIWVFRRTSLTGPSVGFPSALMPSWTCG